MLISSTNSSKETYTNNSLSNLLNQVIEKIEDAKEKKKNNKQEQDKNTNDTSVEISVNTNSLSSKIGLGYNAHYRMLNSRQKKLYIALYAKKSDFIAGRDINLKPLKLLAGNFTTDDTFKVISAIMNDHPEFFYICTQNKGSNNTAYMTYGVSSNKISFSNLRPKLKTELNTINIKAKAVLAVAKTKIGDYNKIKYVHDWLVNNMNYTHNNAGINGFILGKGQCMTYAHMFQYLMNELGIDCIYVVSTDGSHAWNRVKVNGKWYMIDVCWDDEYSTNKYFLKGKSTEAYPVKNDAYYPSLSKTNYK